MYYVRVSLYAHLNFYYSKNSSLILLMHNSIIFYFSVLLKNILGGAEVLNTRKYITHIASYIYFLLQHEFKSSKFMFVHFIQ